VLHFFSGCPGGKLPALITAVRLVTGACTDRSFGTLCLPGDCRVQLDVLVDAFEKCVNSLPDDISKTIAKDWFDIEAATCSSPPGKTHALLRKGFGVFFVTQLLQYLWDLTSSMPSGLQLLVFAMYNDRCQGT